MTNNHQLEDIWQKINLLPYVIKNTIRYQINSKNVKSSMLRQINFAITYKCNSQCKSCGIWKIYKQNPAKAEEELSVTEIKKILNNNKDSLNKDTQILLTGGEPFLRGDIVEIIQQFSNILHTSNIGLSTNGLIPFKICDLTEKITRSIPYVSIAVSIDGTEETHDNLRGIKGSYEKAIQTLNCLLDLKKDVSTLQVGISFTLSKLNFMDLKDVNELSKSMGTKFSFRPIHHSSTYYDNMDISLGKFSESNIRKIEKDVFDILNNPIFNIRNRYFIIKIAEYLRHPDTLLFPCSAGIDSIYMDPYGDIYPCIIMNTKLGNVRTRKISTILNDKKAILVKKNIRLGNCPTCWAECETFKNILNTPHKMIIDYLMTKRSRYYHMRVKK